MLNYIKSELYRIFRSKGIYMLTGICAGLMLAMNIILGFFRLNTQGFRYGNTEFSFSMLTMGGMGVVFFLTFCMASIVFSDEYKFKTIMNSISFGYSRSVILTGKFIVALIVSAACLFIAEGLFIGSAYLLLENSGTQPLMLLLKTTLFNIPIYIAGVGSGIVIFFLSKNVMSATWTWMGIFVGIPMITSILGMKFEIMAKLNRWLIYNIVGEAGYDETGKMLLVWSTPEGMQRCLLAGVLGIIIFMVVGLYGVQKKEIN